MSAPDPITAAFREQLREAIDAVPDPRQWDDTTTDDIVDALEPVIRQIVAAAAAEKDATELGETERMGWNIAEQLTAQNEQLREGIVAVGTALEKLCCAVERELNADASESAPCPIGEWADVHDRLAMLADECGLALDHPAVSPVMEAALDPAPVSGAALPVQTADTADGGAR